MVLKSGKSGEKCLIFKFQSLANIVKKTFNSLSENDCLTSALELILEFTLTIYALKQFCCLTYFAAHWQSSDITPFWRSNTMKNDSILNG